MPSRAMETARSAQSRTADAGHLAPENKLYLTNTKEGSMTLSELYEYLLLGGSVKCDSPQQRNTLARFIQDELGLQIGPGTTDYMTRYPDGTDYMFVELYNMSNGAVVSFCVNALGQTVPFARVAHLITSANAKLDEIGRASCRERVSSPV